MCIRDRISTTAYTTIGVIIPPGLIAPEQNGQYIRAVITGNGAYMPCTAYINMQTGTLVVRADSAITMNALNFVVVPISYIQAS